MTRSIIETSIARSEITLQFGPGEILFREGEEPRGVYLLQSGQVDLVFSTKTGTAKALRGMKAGQILGLSSVVTRTPNDCTATTATACTVGFVDRESFLRTLQESPAVWFTVLQLLSSDVNAVYDDMRLLVAR